MEEELSNNNSNLLIVKFNEETCYWYDMECCEEDGIIEGEKEGIEKTKREIAKNLLKENVDIPLIQKVTNVSMERIKKIKANMNIPINTLALNEFKKDKEYSHEKYIAISNGKIKGESQGRVNERKKLARNLLKENIDIPYIERVTYLPEKLILELKEEL